METIDCLLTDIIAGIYVTYFKQFHVTSNQAIPNITLIQITITIYIYIYTYIHTGISFQTKV